MKAIIIILFVLLLFCTISLWFLFILPIFIKLFITICGLVGLYVMIMALINFMKWKK
jgi:hypothetical protein